MPQENTRIKTWMIGSLFSYNTSSCERRYLYQLFDGIFAHVNFFVYLWLSTFHTHLP